MKLIVSVVFILLGSALSANEARSEAWSSMSTRAMEKVFARPEQTHKAAAKAVGLMEKSHLNSSLVAQVTSMVHNAADAEMAKEFNRPDAVHRKSLVAISSTLTIDGAVKVLDHSSFANSSELKQMEFLISGNNNLRSAKDSNLHDIGGLNGARILLNDMIFEVMEKYDAEIMKCTKYYAEQCNLLAIQSETISKANYDFAVAKELDSDAQNSIAKCEYDMPVTTNQMKEHEYKCEEELKAIDKLRKAAADDVTILTMILEMSDCDSESQGGKKAEVAGASMLEKSEVSIMRCENQCTKETTVSFQGHDALQAQISKLKSESSKKLMAAALADLFDDDDDDDEDAEEPEISDAPTAAAAEVKTMKVKKAPDPVPQFDMPANPCTDPNNGAPDPVSNRGGKCTLKKRPRCYKLQGRFLGMQGDAIDVRDKYDDQYVSTETKCKETTKDFQQSLAQDATLLRASNTKATQASQKQQSADASARTATAEHKTLTEDLKTQMTSCTTNYVNFESELCALRKIRGDLFKKLSPKMLGEDHSGIFQDCTMGKWEPKDCSKSCAKGTQILKRKPMNLAGSGMEEGCKCLPDTAERSCNLQKCPVPCKLAAWGMWAKCSANCGGGTQQRMRDVVQAPMYDAPDCPQRVEMKNCNIEACEKDCVLKEWTAWSTCSKDCDGGTRERTAFVKEAAEGTGECPDQWGLKRLQYWMCNDHSCETDGPNTTLKCNSSLDVAFILDQGPKGGKKIFAAEKELAIELIDAFKGDDITASPSFAVIAFSGPRTWYGVSKCVGEAKEKTEFDVEDVCKVKVVHQFMGPESTESVKRAISKLEFKPGAKLMAMGLSAYDGVATGSRKDKRSTVIVMMHGKPFSSRKTLAAAKEIRKQARLLFVPVVNFSPLKEIKTWATRRWQENLVKVTGDDIKNWATHKYMIGTHVIANICPKEFPKTQNKKELD